MNQWIETMAFESIFDDSLHKQKEVWCLGGECNWGLTVSPNIPHKFIPMYNTEVAYVGAPVLCTLECEVAAVPIPSALLLFGSAMVMLTLIKRRSL